MLGPATSGANAFWRAPYRAELRGWAGFPASAMSKPGCARQRHPGSLAPRIQWPATVPAGIPPAPPESSEHWVRDPFSDAQPLRGVEMLNMNRLAALAAVLLIALPAAVVPLSAQAQPQPAAPSAAPAAPPAPPAAAPAPAPPATPAPVAKAPGGERATEVVENPYGLEALWKGGDMVAKITLGILVIMSMGSWYIIITKVYEQYRMGRQARAAEKRFWSAPSVRQGAESLKKGSPYRFIAESGLEATTKHTGLLGNVDLNTWITMSIQRAIDNVQSRTQDGLAFLATVGSTAPFVGLFGTVWGIYHALTAIGIAGQASIDKVAGPVGEALIMTALGLAVAVPAVLGYNWLIRRNKSAMEQVRGFGADLHAVLLSTPQSAAAKA
jgi:biopolymer transport protein ExbB